MLVPFQIPRGVIPRTYISPQRSDVSHTREASDHCQEISDVAQRKVKVNSR